MGLNIFIVAEKSGDAISPDIRSIIIFFILIAVQLMCGKVLKKKLSPILMIVFSAVLGIVFFGGGI